MNSTACLITYHTSLPPSGRTQLALSTRTPPRIWPALPPVSSTRPSSEPLPAPPLVRVGDVGQVVGSSRVSSPPECAKLGVPWLSPGELVRFAQLIQALEVDDFNPLLRKMPLQEHYLQRVAELFVRSDPHQLLTLLLLYGHNGFLRAGELTSELTMTSVISGPAGHGKPVLAVQDISDGPGVPGPVSRSPDAQRGVPHAVGQDRAPSLGDGIPLSQEAIRHSF